jgi:hypothetical protein
MRPRDRITAVAVAVAIAAAVLAIGGAPRWALAVIAVPTVIAVGAQLTSRRGFDRRAPLLVLVGIALGLTAIQATPVPSAARATLDPVGDSLARDGDKLLGDQPAALVPLSLDPSGTRRAALDLALAFAVAWVLLRLSVSSRGRYAIQAVVAGVCGLAAAIGALDQVLGATTLYGLYDPHHATPTVLGPLLNPNSYGSLLVVGTMVSGGLALHTPQSSARRALWAIDAALCLSVAMWTLSRGAALAAAIGAVTLATVLIAQRRRRERERRRPHFLRVTLPATVLVLCAVALVVLSSAGGVARQIGDTSTDELSDPLSKYAAWRSAGTLIRETPWIGVGRGAFEASFTRVHPESAYGTFAYLENEYLQAVVDWGVPGAVALALVTGWLALAAGRRRREGALAAGALGALAAVAAQSTVDFGLELPGLLIPVIAVAATVTYVPLHELGRNQLRRAIAARGAMIAAIALLVVLVVPPWGSTLIEDHDALVADDPPTVELAQAMMRKHPLDYFAPARAASALLARHDLAGMQYLNRALVLHPTHPGLHRLAARALAATGHPAQAQLEFRTAMRVSRDPTPVVGEIIQTFPGRELDLTVATIPGWFPWGVDRTLLATLPSAEMVAGALPDDYANLDLLTKTLTSWHRPDVTLRFLVRVTRHSAADVDTLDLLAHSALAVGDLAAAEDAARRRLKVAPGAESLVGLGQILVKRGELAEAEAALHGAPTAAGPPPRPFEAWLLLCDVQMQRKEWSVAEGCLQKLMGSPNLTSSMRRQVHGRLAIVAQALGDTYRAKVEHKLSEAPPP